MGHLLSFTETVFCDVRIGCQLDPGIPYYLMVDLRFYKVDGNALKLSGSPGSYRYKYYAG